MPRLRISEPRSGLSVRFDLLAEAAPRAVEALRLLAADDRAWPALHAMWTGPEISCAMSRSDLPDVLKAFDLPVENPVREPDAGALVLTPLQPGPPAVTRPFPDGGLDLGVFYGPWGRLLFPEGWVDGSLCGRAVPEDLAHLAEGGRRIRLGGRCHLSLAFEP